MIKEFSVSKRANSVVIYLDRQTQLAIYTQGGNLVFSDKSNTKQLTALLQPGRYFLETDGRVKSLKTRKKGGQDLE